MLIQPLKPATAAIRLTGAVLQGASRVRIGSVVMDCRDFRTMMRFWEAALHYVPSSPPSEGWVVLKDPTGRSPNISINLDPELERHTNSIHLDLYTEDQKVEVERLLALGATLHRSPEPGEDFVVLADPEGNLFCVVDATER